MAKVIEDKTFDGERALYGSRGVKLRRVAFDGPADGESALKESADIEVENCYCNLRYPFWHVDGIKITDTELTANCRAALWFSNGIKIEGCKLHGIKALRECKDVEISNTDVDSPEFGWSTDGMKMSDCRVKSEYFMLRSRGPELTKVDFDGKYSFQYVENAQLSGCKLNTKDAFWNSKNVTVRDSVVNGEYLGWYSDGLTLINCTIRGTQPFCYCKNLRLINCRMEECDLAFEKSEAEAEITTPVISVKNPYRGKIILPAVGEIIRDDPLAVGEIVIKG